MFKIKIKSHKTKEYYMEQTKYDGLRYMVVCWNKKGSLIYNIDENDLVSKAHE